MIEKFELESNTTDWAGLLGRGALIGGAGFATYKTFQGAIGRAGGAGMPSQHFRSQMGQLAKMNLASDFAQDIRMGKMDIHSLFGTTLKNLRPFEYTSSLSKITGELSALGGGYKGLSGELPGVVKGIYQDLTSIYGLSPADIAMGTKGGPGDLGLLRFKIETAGGPKMFDLRPVSKTGAVAIGSDLRTKYAARQVAESFDAVTGKLKLVGQDVYAAKQIRENLGKIIRGDLDPQELVSKIYSRSIFEQPGSDLFKGADPRTALGQIRREQVLLDPVGRLGTERLDEMYKQLSVMEGYGAGSAAQRAKGIINTPVSLLAKGTPGIESTVSGYQLFRESQFIGATPSTVDWLPGTETKLSKFKVATVAEEDISRLKNIFKRYDVGVGELAAEEVLLSSDPISVKNKVYNLKVDVEKGLTPFTERIVKQAQRQMGVGKDLSVTDFGKLLQTEGIKDVDIDLLSKLRTLQDREQYLSNALEYERNAAIPFETKTRNISKIKDDLKKVKSAIGDFGQMGFAPDTGEVVRVPSAFKAQKITNMRMNNGILNIALESHYDFDELSKVFSGGGGGKWTVKGRVDIGDMQEMLAQLEYQKLYGTEAFASKAKLTELGLIDEFKGIQMLSVEAPIKIKGGALPQREAMTAIMSYSERVAATGTPKEIARLSELGIAEGRFTGTGLKAKELIEKIRGWHPGKTPEEIFLPKAGLATTITDVVLSPDIAAAQAGIGKTGTISERALMNFRALGLGEFTEDIMSRKMNIQDPFMQMKDLEYARNSMAGGKVRSAQLGQLEDYIKSRALFDPSAEARQRVFSEIMGESVDNLVVNLDKEIAGIKRVTIFGSEAMAPYYGKAFGSEGMKELDLATSELIETSRRGREESVQIKAAERYKAALLQTEESIAKTTFKGRIKGSMYGQAVSGLEGMDDAARELARGLGMREGTIGPMVAMREEDILRKMGKGALEKARARELWGSVVREPVEGMHKTIPTQIRIAEDFTRKPLPTGGIWVTGEDAASSMLRRGLFVDFDRDTLNVIAATNEKSSKELRGFMTRGKTIMGDAYVDSMMRMASFKPKGLTPPDITALDQRTVSYMNDSIKKLEKTSIGHFSNEFKKIHAGLREQLSGSLTKAGADAMALGEDFSHLFIENILKSKHQSVQNLLEGKAERVLGLLSQKPGTEFAKMREGTRVAEMQDIFSELVLGDKKLGRGILQAEDVISDELARLAASGESIEIGRERAANFRQIASKRNVENILVAHKRGGKLLAEGNYIKNIINTVTRKSMPLVDRAVEASQVVGGFMKKGLRNVGKYAILPAAAIGLGASLLSSPGTMSSPAEETGRLHEAEKENVPAKVSIPRTLFEVPDTAMSKVRVRGNVNRGTNLQSLSALALQSGDEGTVRIADHRKHLNKYDIDEMVKKGY